MNTGFKKQSEIIIMDNGAVELTEEKKKKKKKLIPIENSAARAVCEIWKIIQT